MNYEISFWCLVTACFVRFVSVNKFYIGPDRSKYDAANYSFLVGTPRNGEIPKDNPERREAM